MSDDNKIHSESINTNTLSVSKDFDGEIQGAVPIAELEELIGENMDDASKQYDDAHSGYERGMGHGRIKAYSKINALIEEHKHD